MHKIINSFFSMLLFAAGISAVAVPDVLAYCDPANISTGRYSVAVSDISDVDLTGMLSLTNTYSVTISSNFSGYKLACFWGGETLYYRSGIEGGYTVKFTSGDLDTYIKFTATLPISSKYFDNENPASSFDTDITLTTEIVAGPDYDVATSGGNTEVPLLYLISNGWNSTYPTASALRNLINTKAAAEVSALDNLKGFASLNVFFSPVSTTCLIDNQQFSLPSTTLYAIRAGEIADTQFNVPVVCSGSVNSLVTRTFDLRAYSSDIVDDARYIIRNTSSTSSGIGFQLFNEKDDPLKISAGYDSASTSLASMTAGKDNLGSLTSFNIGARYKIFDAAAASPGKIVGTIVIYMEYK
ncbi:fimbrial protein [Pantoea septica]|uniref:fimbrial protein n=1 Tax=Pantoea septica TaxID=472695 RepID=UPI0023F081EB|nr:fimbrial protein [Pantoea septica]